MRRTAPRGVYRFAPLRQFGALSSQLADGEGAAYVAEDCLRHRMGALAARAQDIHHVRAVTRELGTPGAYRRDECFENVVETPLERDVSEPTSLVTLLQLINRRWIRIERSEVGEDDVPLDAARVRRQIGRASCRERVLYTV